MLVRKKFVVFGTVALLSSLALIGCSDPQANTSSSPVATVEKTNSGLSQLQTIVSNTKSAVESGNLTQAQNTFDSFENVWKKVEDGIKRQNANTYDAIESNLDKVSGDLKAAPPKQAVILSALQALETELASITN